ncbi:MAG: PAS domain S-box protein, partial [Thermoleophilia bacterium]|nr:PAS domain S-box protein [Thermoleophilia bacterium]
VVAAALEDRRRAEHGLEERVRERTAELAEQKERLRTTLASIGDGVITTDVDGRVTQLNPVAEALTGWPSSSAEGRPLGDVFRTRDEATGAPAENPADRALRDGAVVGLANHTVLVSRDGAMRPIDDRAAPIRSRDGEVVGCVLVFRDVTDRREAEARLRRSEADYRLIVEGNPALICRFLPDGTLTFVNDTYCRTFGADREALIGRRLVELVPEEDRPVVNRMMAALAPDMEPFTSEHRVRVASGEVRWQRWTNKAAAVEPGRPAEYQAVGVDITDRRRVEEALRDREAHFRTMADDAPTMIWVTDPEGSCTYLSRRWYEFTGTAPDSGLGIGWLRCVHPDDRDEAGRVFLTANARRAPFTLDYRVRRHDGAYRWAIDAGQPRFGPDGGFLGFVGTVSDIHDRRLAEVAAREAEGRFRTLADHAPVLIWQTDERGVTFVNRHYVDFFGEPLESLAGMGWARFLHPDDAAYLDAYGDAFRERRPFEGQARFLRRDGEYRWLQNVGTPHSNPSGEFVGFFGCSLDVTDARRAAEALAEVDRRKDEFLATLAHELRNPLAPIRNGLQLMKLAGADPAEVERSRSMMERQLEQMVRLVDDLMDVARITRGKVDLRLQRIAISAAVASAVEASRPLIDRMGHALTVDLPGTPIHVEADLTRLAQVFMNLLNNAAKYSERGARIRLAVERRGGEVSVSVRDTGI